ncbi:hypothetical protein ACFVS2_25515 [Brevibacillus sp. NPDC058079]|uniref:hypothetical protein n=1 Tax=Brevibacillus sp. NPDC058079 TaxID=3346330 RepID=UPI0036EFD3A6
MSMILTEKEIGIELIRATSKIVEKVEVDQSDKELTLYYGVVLGLLIALGRADSFYETDSHLGYINSILVDIFGEDLAELKSIEGREYQ